MTNQDGEAKTAAPRGNFRERPQEKSQKKSLKKSQGLFFLKIALSIFIVYHLATVLILPNNSSVLVRKLAHLFTPYASTLGFNTTWQFFSPGPSPEFFLEYRAETKEDVENGLDVETRLYPPQKAPYSINDFYNRKLYGMRFFALNPERLEKYFIPFLCRQVPGTVYLSLRSVFIELPSLERAGTLETYQPIGETIQIPQQRFECPATDPALNEKADGADLVIDPGLEKDPAKEISEENDLPYSDLNTQMPGDAGVEEAGGVTE